MTVAMVDTTHRTNSRSWLDAQRTRPSPVSTPTATTAPAAGRPAGGRSVFGRTAIVTAGGAGIGAAIAREWARCGGRAAIGDLDGGAARAVAEQIKAAGGEAVALPMDVAQPDAAAPLIIGAIAAFGEVDTLFNVAGVNLPKRVDEMDDPDWYRIIDVNLTSVYRCSKQVIPFLRQHGGGAIVNVASTAGILAENRCAAYSAAKAGVINLTRNMAMDYAADGIRVNAVCPGSTMSPRIERYLRAYPGHDEMMTALSPMRRFGRPEEIARPAVFLASDDASYITGAALVVDGGMTAGTRMAIFEDAGEGMR